MTRDLSRARALIRDEGRLRQALELHKANRFDIGTFHRVRLSVAGLMETLEALVHDEQFWRDLEDKGHVLEVEEIDAFRWFDDAAFAVLLTTCGYASPPPPSVDELISDTQHSVGVALQAASGVDQIAEARRRLHVFLYRTRRQLSDVDAGRTTGTAPIGRRLGIVARKYIPIVAGLAAGAAMEMALPSGLWLATAGGLMGLATSTVEKGAVQGTQAIAKRASGWAVMTLVGDTLLDAPPADDESEHGALPTPDEAVAAHLAMALQLTDRLVEEYQRPAQPALRTASAHLERVVELCDDGLAGSDVVAEAAALAHQALSMRLEEKHSKEGRKVAWEALKLSARALERLVRQRDEDYDFMEDMFSTAPEPKSELASLEKRWQSLTSVPAVPKATARPSAIGAVGGWTTTEVEATAPSQQWYESS